jgi:hypothetical protein
MYGRRRCNLKHRPCIGDSDWDWVIQIQGRPRPGPAVAAFSGLAKVTRHVYKAGSREYAFGSSRRLHPDRPCFRASCPPPPRRQGVEEWGSSPSASTTCRCRRRTSARRSAISRRACSVENTKSRTARFREGPDPVSRVWVDAFETVDPPSCNAIDYQRDKVRTALDGMVSNQKLQSKTDTLSQEPLEKSPNAFRFLKK